MEIIKVKEKSDLLKDIKEQKQLEIILDVDLCQYLGHNFFRFLRIFFLKFYRA